MPPRALRYAWLDPLSRYVRGPVASVVPDVPPPTSNDVVWAGAAGTAIFEGFGGTFVRSFNAATTAYLDAGVDEDTIEEWLDSVGITFDTFVNALDVYVIGLQTCGHWAKSSALYLMVGTEESTVAINLRSPGDFDLAISGGSAQADLGWKFNPTGSVAGGHFADTGFVPVDHLSQNSTHLLYRSGADLPAISRCEIGCFNWPGGSGCRFHIIASYTPGSFYYGMSDAGVAVTPSATSEGLFVATRTEDDLQVAYHDGVFLDDSTNASVPLPGVSVHLGGINSFGDKTDLPCLVAGIGDGLDASAVSDFYAIDSIFQAAIGRG